MRGGRRTIFPMDPFSFLPLFRLPWLYPSLVLLPSHSLPFRAQTFLPSLVSSHPVFAFPSLPLLFCRPSSKALSVDFHPTSPSRQSRWFEQGRRSNVNPSRRCSLFSFCGSLIERKRAEGKQGREEGNLCSDNGTAESLCTARRRALKKGWGASVKERNEKEVDSLPPRRRFLDLYDNLPARPAFVELLVSLRNVVEAPLAVDRDLEGRRRF